MSWRWTAQRLSISCFAIFHVAATVTWICPASPLQRWAMPVFRYYMVPLGLWQSWWMFAPDPMRVTLGLEAEVIDAFGMRHIHEFPCVAELPWWRKAPRFRHPKFACNLLSEEYLLQREYAARHVVRRFDLPESSFPVHVRLYYQVTDVPSPGEPAGPAARNKRLHPLATYCFASRDEINP